jgi:hypothetical protein
MDDDGLYYRPGIKTASPPIRKIRCLANFLMPYKECGFQERGRFVKIERKRGRDFDVVWMQMIIALAKIF